MALLHPGKENQQWLKKPGLNQEIKLERPF
jgi:hypothetical protein